MTRFHEKQLRNLLLHAFKIGLGSSFSIYVATALGLDYAITAGSKRVSGQ